MTKHPEKILVSNKDIDDICKEYIEKDRLDKVFWFLIGLIIPAWISFIVLDFNKWMTGYTVYLTIIVLLTIVTVVILCLCLKQRKQKSIAEQIKIKAYNDSDYSALFIIARINTDINGKQSVNVLVQEKDTWNCLFLPYLDIDKKIPLEEQKDDLRKGIASKLNIPYNALKIHLLEDAGCYSIKLAVPENTEKLFQHEFYMVTINNSVEDYLLKNQEWADIDSLARDANVVRVNGDVVDRLMSLKSRIKNSFESNELFHNSLKIIWNITKECLFDCQICATYSGQKRELSEYEKAKVLLALAGIKNDIIELNFAGGDPLVNLASKKIIKYARELFGKQKISISTTGRGIEKLANSEEMFFLNNCVLSIDSYDFEEEGVRNTVDYNKINARNGKRYREYMSKLRINIPILKTDLDDSEIEKIAKKVNEINPNEVSLLNLMPVGRLDKSNYPDDYKPANFVQTFRKYINPTIKLHIHCALRCACFVSEERCTMLTRKVGIDCEGNVFACCWAGYLNCTLDSNPFFLGNLLEHDMKEILVNDRAIELLEKVDRSKCSVIEYQLK